MKGVKKMDDIEMENGDYIDYDDFCDNAQEEALEDSLVEMPSDSTPQEIYDDYEERTDGEYAEREAFDW